MMCPFDAVAEGYDRTFTHTRLGRWLREAVWEHLAAAFRPGDHVLELGCGTGEDAVWLARRGIHVVATDASPAMLEMARRKTRAAGVADRVTFARLDLESVGGGYRVLDIRDWILDTRDWILDIRDWILGIRDWDMPIPNTQYPISNTQNTQYPISDTQHLAPNLDGAFSNFGALNCLPDRRPVAEALARWVRPGGKVVLVVMGPLCPWEMAWHLGHGEVRRAFRRWRAGVEAQVGDGATVRVWYPSPWRLRQEFAPYFRHLKTVGIGVLLPPSYLSHLAERWPRPFAALAALDRCLGRRFPWAWLGDHYLVVLERVGGDDSRPPTAASFENGGRRSAVGGRSAVRGQRSAVAFACPACRTPLEAAGPEEQRCPADGAVYRRVEGIWRFLLPEREDFFRQFMQEYETVRRAEGRGSDDPTYYRALPFEDRTGRFRDDWRIRAKSFRTLVERILVPLEAERGRPLAILDLGAGNGWLSYRLAQRGHGVAAVDLLTNAFDGLGAHVHYDVAFTPVQAEFDRLPFTDDGADLIVFNASLHYSTSYETTLGEALRVLRPNGRLVIMDSPVYHDPASGDQMVREREAQFEEKYGFPSNALPSENYVTYDRLEELAEALELRWQLIRPFYGWRWALRPWKARLLGRREPAQFLVIVGRRP